jgi:mannitol/fructose-specific phosphotransferase system IIA component (Ntr-type)
MRINRLRVLYTAGGRPYTCTARDRANGRGWAERPTSRDTTAILPVRRRSRAHEVGTNMELREFFDRDAVQLNLKGESKDEILKELISLLKLDDKSEGILFKMLKRRENLGSTGIGRGIAIPHCRSLVVNRLRVAFGRKPGGVDFNAIDNQPVHNFFLIVAPPLEVSNQYLPVLGKLAQFAKEPETTRRLEQLESGEQFLQLLEQKAQ